MGIERWAKAASLLFFVGRLGYCYLEARFQFGWVHFSDDGLHTKVFIRGSGFTEDHQALRILVNDTTCYVTASNRTDLVCQMKMLPVGLYQVMLLVRPYGFALNASTGGDIYLRIEPKLVAVEPSRASEIGRSESKTISLT